MPNRILRDWTDSEAVNGLTAEAERFFTRLIMKVDDYGRYSANPTLLKSMLFPLLDGIRQTDISHWMAACQKAGLIAVYDVHSRPYVQIKNFNQRMRQMTAKYPSPEEGQPIDGQLTVNCQSSDGVKRIEEKRRERKCEATDVAPPTQGNVDPDFIKLQAWMKTNTPTVLDLKEPLTLDQFRKLKAKFSKDQIARLLEAMHNHKLLLTKYRSAYLTFLNWSKREGPDRKAQSVHDKHLPDAKEVLSQYD